jgi:DNA-binding protein HU-beta/integration host factor subunit beta
MRFDRGGSQSGSSVTHESSQNATKRDLVRTIAERAGLPQAQVKNIVQITFDSLIDTLLSERRIELRGFGVFEIRRRAARVGRNPRTGKPVPVQARCAVAFKPGKQMEARVATLAAESRESTGR